FGADPLWEGLETWGHQAAATLGGQGELATAVIWNAGTYLWQAGLEANLTGGLERCRDLLSSGVVMAHLQRLRQEMG
ncbi:MAG: anthranilate phosphoribosyltransferase, partial [Vulcanococcus sp.]